MFLPSFQIVRYLVGQVFSKLTFHHTPWQKKINDIFFLVQFRLTERDNSTNFAFNVHLCFHSNANSAVGVYCYCCGNSFSVALFCVWNRFWTRRWILCNLYYLHSCAAWDLLTYRTLRGQSRITELDVVFCVLRKANVGKLRDGGVPVMCRLIGSRWACVISQVAKSLR